MRFPWNEAIQAAALLADQPDMKGPLTGKGYQVKRNPKKGKKQQFVIIVTEGEYGEEQENAS